MDRERVIVYIDENTDDGMMWEELNQEGQMQVSVYDEELEYDVEYSHSIVVKSLQEYLAEHDKEVSNQVINGIKKQVQDQIIICGAKATEQDIIEANSYNSCISDIIDILDKIQGSEE